MEKDAKRRKRKMILKMMGVDIFLMWVCLESYELELESII